MHHSLFIAIAVAATSMTCRAHNFLDVMGTHPFDGWLRGWRLSALGHYFAGEHVSDSADLAYYDLGRNVLRTPRGVAIGYLQA